MHSYKKYNITGINTRKVNSEKMQNSNKTL